MTDPKGASKINMRSPWTVLQILLISAVICILKISDGSEIKQYLKNYKSHKVQQDHSQEYL